MNTHSTFRKTRSSHTIRTPRRGRRPVVSGDAAEDAAEDGLVENCTLGSGAASRYGHDDACDAVWNVALSGIYTLDSLTGSPPCSDLGYFGSHSADRCLTLYTFGVPGGCREFTVHVAVAVGA